MGFTNQVLLDILPPSTYPKTKIKQIRMIHSNIMKSLIIDSKVH